jgi:CMP-2-keto-3-deoxyoctulosonic acid synthetase
MRFIDNNEKIICTEVTDSNFAVDYPSDIKKIEKLIKSNKKNSK